MAARGGCAIKKKTAKPIDNGAERGGQVRRKSFPYLTHPVRARCGGFAAFSWWRVHPSFGN